MVLLSKKGAHGVSARCEKVCVLLPQRSPGGTLENHTLFIANSITAVSQTDPVSPVYMASASLPASNNWQAMTCTAQPKLQKSLHAPPRNRKLTMPPPTWVIRLKPLLVYTSMKQSLECGLHEDNTDCQNQYSASIQSEPPQHCPHLKRASHHARHLKTHECKHAANSPLARRMSLHHGITDLCNNHCTDSFILPWFLPRQLEILSMGQPYF